jgi:hypothetical protein
MEWILLEALVALSAGLAIVWWTMSAGRRRGRGEESRDAGRSEGTAERRDGAER